MKQRIHYREWIEFTTDYPEPSTDLIRWATTNNYMIGGTTYMPTIGEMVHFLIQHGKAFAHEDKLDLWVNHSLVYEDVAIGWNGKELCDILWWECKMLLTKLK